MRLSTLSIYSRCARWQGTKNPFSAMNNLSINEAKTRVRIPDLWRHYNLPGQPGKSCKSPFRQDNNPSFSVSEDGLLFHDFATGDAGDALDFLQRVSGLTQKTACRHFIKLAGGNYFQATQPARPHCPPITAKPKPCFPNFRSGTADEINHLAGLRNIGREGIKFASERGLLHFATLKDCPAWIITDAARVNAQARRMDGKKWEHISAKAWTLPGFCPQNVSR